MQNNKYYEEIEHLIQKKEVNKTARLIKDNNETLVTYWNVGRIIVEAQGGEVHAKYGNSLIKKWSERLTVLYGKGYDVTNLKRFRQFYLLFPKGGPVGPNLSWSHYRYLIPIKEENKRNYYLNLVITRNLSKRELIKEINSNSYDRLLDKPERIELITDNKVKYQIKENIKNPIIIKLDKQDIVLNEHDLQIKILAKLKNFFQELGEGYTFVGNEYKINYGTKNYYVDILLFNYKLNSFVVVELKMRELRIEDKSQIEFYMKLVDEKIKEDFHKATIGIIVSRSQDEFIVSFVSQDKVIPVTYLLEVK